jgi:hypothetical protein
MKMMMRLRAFEPVAFDLESEEWKAEKISGPALGHQKYGEIWFITLVEFNGTLAFVHDVRVNHYTYSSTWLLIDPNKSVWVKEYMIPISKNQIGTTKPLGVLVDGRILLWSSVFDNEETRLYNFSFRRRREVVLFYDPGTKAFNRGDGRGVRSDVHWSTLGASYLQHK